MNDRSKIQKGNYVGQNIFNQKDSNSIARNIFENKIISPKTSTPTTTPTTITPTITTRKEDLNILKTPPTVKEIQIRREELNSPSNSNSNSNSIGPGNSRQGKFLSPKSPDLFKLKKKK